MTMLVESKALWSSYHDMLTSVVEAASAAGNTPTTPDDSHDNHDDGGDDDMQVCLGRRRAVSPTRVTSDLLSSSSIISANHPSTAMVVVDDEDGLDEEALAKISAGQATAVAVALAAGSSAETMLLSDNMSSHIRRKKPSKIRFGPNQTLHYSIPPSHRLVAKHKLWWTKSELDRLRNDYKMHVTQTGEMKNILRYVHGYEASYRHVVDVLDELAFDVVETSGSNNTPMEDLLYGLRCGYHGLERCTPSLEASRQGHRRTTVRHVVDTYLRLYGNPYRHELVRAVSLQYTSTVTEWAVCLGAAATVAAVDAYISVAADTAGTATTATAVHQQQSLPSLSLDRACSSAALASIAAAVPSHVNEETKQQEYQRIEV